MSPRSLELMMLSPQSLRKVLALPSPRRREEIPGTKGIEVLLWILHKLVRSLASQPIFSTSWKLSLRWRYLKLPRVTRSRSKLIRNKRKIPTVRWNKRKAGLSFNSNEKLPMSRGAKPDF